jgi:hypothetical protein
MRIRLTDDRKVDVEIAEVEVSGVHSDFVLTFSYGQ